MSSLTEKGKCLSPIGRENMALWRRKPVAIDLNQYEILLLLRKTVRLPSKTGIVYQAY